MIGDSQCLSRRNRRGDLPARDHRSASSTNQALRAGSPRRARRAARTAAETAPLGGHHAAAITQADTAFRSATGGCQRPVRHGSRTHGGVDFRAAPADQGRALGAVAADGDDLDGAPYDRPSNLHKGIHAASRAANPASPCSDAATCHSYSDDDGQLHAASDRTGQPASRHPCGRARHHATGADGSRADDTTTTTGALRSGMPGRSDRRRR